MRWHASRDSRFGPAGLLCLGLALVLLSSGCGKRAATVQPAPTPSAESTATSPPGSPSPAAANVSVPPAPTATPTAVPFSLQTPLPMPTPFPSPSGVVNLLSWGQGAVVRAWPPNAVDLYPAKLLTGDGWKPKSGAPPPYEFVFELPRQAMLERFALRIAVVVSAAPAPLGSTSPAPLGSARIAVSAGGPDGPFNDVGSVAVGDDAQREQTLAPAAPVGARWIRLHLDAPSNAVVTIAEVAAYGNLAPAALQARDFAGAFYREGLFDSAHSPAIDAVRGRLKTSVDVKPSIAQGTDLNAFGSVVHDPYIQIASCAGNPGVTLRGIAGGGRVAYVHDAAPNGSLVMNAEGTRLTGIDGPFALPYLLYKIAGVPSCRTFADNGTGRTKVTVLTQAGNQFIGPDDSSRYPGYRFTRVWAPLFDSPDLAGVDSVVFDSACWIGLELAPWQSDAILTFVQAGHKLIIHDADRCSSANYSFLPYPPVLSATGRVGQKSGRLTLVESDTLGADESDPRHFLDTAAFLANQFQQLGDSDIMTSTDPHWCGHLLTTNGKGASGYVQAYAHYGAGLIIYDGLDYDNAYVPQFRQVLQYELAQPVAGRLPCTHGVGGFALGPGRTQKTYVIGKAQRATASVEAFAVGNYRGTLQLESHGPWASQLSRSSIALDANAAAFTFFTDVPVSARGRGHVFTVRAVDANGRRAEAQVEFVPGKAPAIEQELATLGRVELHNILFDTASAQIRPESNGVLAEIANILGRNAGWKLSIEGHTDNVGGAAYNLDLSRRRAASVKSALVRDFHIDARRLATAGYGLTRPIASNETAQGRQQNRRVELVRH
jgi:outer membrane protein OmpA-like peptidoglycan-associated protein